jgi:hypothetical protein
VSYRRLAPFAVLVAAACGDDLAPPTGFDIVGHSALGGRGMNSALAIAGDVAYVGSRTDLEPVLIVDIADPANPAVVGAIRDANEAVAGISPRELRVLPDLDLLLVLNLQCSPQLHGCGGTAATPENIAVYDISDRRAPVLAAVHVVAGTARAVRSPHEMFVWRDPAAARAIVYLTTPPAEPSLEIFAVSRDGVQPLATWDPIKQGGLPASASADNILHSIALSDDGRTAYLSHQVDGLAIVDTSSVIDAPNAIALTMITPPAQVLDWIDAQHAGIGPHSAVPVPDRALLVVTEEIYAPPYGIGCPWGHARIVDIADPARPRIAGEVGVPENDASYCASGAPLANAAFTAHNATATRDLALVTWYAGGLQAIDISDAAHPRRVAELRPDPLAVVAKEDPALDGARVEMWSYPIIDGGLVYVVDVRNGLYVLRYRGPFEDEIATTRFREGNSNVR